MVSDTPAQVTEQTHSIAARIARVALAFGVSLTAALMFSVSAVAGFQLATWDRVKPGVAVLGVPLGGLTPDEAAASLEPYTTAILDRGLELQFGDRRWNTNARDLGLRLDPTELAESAYRVGRQGPPQKFLREQLEAFEVGADVPVRQTVDGTPLDRLMKRIATELDRLPQEAQLDLSPDGMVVFAPSQTGLKVDEGASWDAVARALVEGLPTAQLVTQTLSATVTTDQVAVAHEQLVRILDQGVPVQLRAAERTWTLERSDLLELVSLSGPGGPASPATVNINDEPLRALVEKIAQDIDQEPREARFALSDAQLTLIRPSQDGRALDRPAASDLLASKILAGERTLELPVVPVRPGIASDEASKLGTPQLIDESTTAFAGAIPEKAHNIQLAAQRLNGVVVPPGGTFSFNKEVGPTTVEAGFQWGFGLTTGTRGGVHTVPSVAGGICQVATTLFQPVFWAGYQLEERYWHLYWIPAYTSRGRVGLDATVDADAGLDFKWVNTTNDYVLIQASTDADHVTFQLYGKKPAWNVTVDDPVISRRVAPDPTPEVQQEPLLPWGRVIPVETAREGFQAVIIRHVLPDGGGAPRDLVLKSVYQPAHTVTLVGTGNAPDTASVASAVERVRASQAPRVAAAPAASSPAAAPAPATAEYPTPNGPRSLAEIRDELRRAGWGGGSDEDALATYRRVAGAAQAPEPADAGH